MLDDLQVICGSVVGENCCLPASTETPVLSENIKVFKSKFLSFVTKVNPNHGKKKKIRHFSRGHIQA